MHAYTSTHVQSEMHAVNAATCSEGKGRARAHRLHFSSSVRVCMHARAQHSSVRLVGLYMSLRPVVA
jgi:hypothetical protein